MPLHAGFGAKSLFGHMDYPSILRIGCGQFARTPDTERGHNAAHKSDGNQAVPVALVEAPVVDRLSLEREVDGGFHRTKKRSSLRRAPSDPELRANR